MVRVTAAGSAAAGTVMAGSVTPERVAAWSTLVAVETDGEKSA